MLRLRLSGRSGQQRNLTLRIRSTNIAMKNFAKFAVLPFTICGVLAPVCAAPEAPTTQSQNANSEAATIANLISQLTASELDWETRLQAEERLKTFDSQAILLAIMPVAAQGRPESFAIYNGSGSAQGDKSAPPKWQIYYAVSRLWDYHNKAILQTDKTRFAPIQRQMVSYLSADSTAKFWAVIQFYIRPNELWTSDAETAFVGLMRRPETADNLRLYVLRCLTRATKSKYYSEMKAIVRAYPENNSSEIYLKAEGLQSLLWVSLHKNDVTGQLEPDEELLKIAFELLPDMEKIREGGGYFLALRLGEFLKQNFQASQGDPKYKVKGNLSDAFFGDTTANAVAWWKRNQAEK